MSKTVRYVLVDPETGDETSIDGMTYEELVAAEEAGSQIVAVYSDARAVVHASDLLVDISEVVIPAPSYIDVRTEAIYNTIVAMGTELGLIEETVNPEEVSEDDGGSTLSPTLVPMGPTGQTEERPSFMEALANLAQFVESGD